jgi:hypothetical protein
MGMISQKGGPAAEQLVERYFGYSQPVQ